MQNTQGLQAGIGRRNWRRLAALVPLLVACGCSSNAGTGALVGGGAGAVGGAIVGAALHNPAAGAAIGAAAGAGTGALIGHSMDKKEEQAKTDAIAAAQQAQQNGVAEVGKMARDHIGDAVIIQKIRTDPVVYHLSAPEIEWLKANGVSDPVIMEMQATANRIPRRVYTAAPVYGQPVYVVDPGPPPPPAVGVGVGFGYVHR